MAACNCRVSRSLKPKNIILYSGPGELLCGQINVVPGPGTAIVPPGGTYELP